MPVSKRLIANADDFGRSPGVNRGIIEAHRRGIVSSATLLVTCPAAEPAAALSREHPALGVGLHLALSGVPPALPAGQIPTLVGADGRLPAKPEGLTRTDPQELLAELRAQLRRFRELMGRLPTHLDSHHHAHQLPLVLEAVVTLAWETGLPVRSVSTAMRERLRLEAIPTPDRFVAEFHGDGATLEGLLRILGSLDLGTTELMCHPAVVDDVLKAESGYAEPRARELEALTSPELRAALQAAGIRLVSYAGF